MRLSIIVPCYNEEEVIRETHSRIKKTLLENGIGNHEILYIDDGSEDGTFGALEEIAGTDPDVKVVSFSRNFGHQTAVTAGIHRASGDAAVIIDADLQDPPSLIPEMLRMHLDEGYDVVYGVRSERRGESAFKRISAKAFYRFLGSLSDVKIPLDAGDFRLIDRKVIEAFKGLGERNKYVRGLVSWLGFRQAPLLYTREERFAGKTKYPLRKMLAFARDGMLSFSKKPLRLATMVGFLSVGVGLALAIYAIVSHYALARGTVSGWTSTIIVIVFFGGVQLLTAGVLGEYLGAVFDEVKGRPEYVVAKTINLD